MGRSALAGIGAGLVAVCLVALGSRLLALGPGDADLVSTFPSSAGRLSYPTGYWNALGAMAAMAVPVLVWLATEVRRRPLLGIVLAALRAGPARRLHDLLPRGADRRCARVRPW